MTLKLKRTPGIYLVGFMASGKSTIGRALAEDIGWPFIDLDTEIEIRAGKRITEIFSELGEPAFRDLETSILRRHISKVETGQPLVLALGGGAFIQDRNWQMITNNGITLWLDCPLETVRRRLGDDNTRPLAANRNGLGKLFEDRRPLYARADYRVDVDTDHVHEIVKRILALPLF
jgi:shikimate kinase